jgi:putative transposase
MLRLTLIVFSIDIERTKPGNPQQNGCHERMHLTLKQDTTKPAAATFLEQQAKFDAFIDCFNIERPRRAGWSRVF